MTKAWKKLSILALAAALAAMVAMVGCSSNEQKTEEKATENTTTAEAVELQVFAANSLSKAMEEVQAAYIEDGHSNVSFADTQYKSSGELNEMLGAGSYADLLISASKGSMDTAVKEGYVDEGTRVDMFKNDLVMSFIGFFCLLFHYSLNVESCFLMNLLNKFSFLFAI